MDLREIAPGLLRSSEGHWLAPEEIATSYPADGNDACLAFEDDSFWFAHRNRAIVTAIRRFPPVGPIFDVGAGNGYVAAALENSGFPTIAIEPNPAGAANAVARGVTNVVRGGLPSSAFRPATAGAIGLFDVLEHVADDRGFIRSLLPYLAPGGRVYATVPAFPRLWSSNDERSGHFRRYTISGLRQTLGDAGLSIDYATYFFWWLPIAIFAFRAMRSENSQARAQRQHTFGGKAFARIVTASLAFEVRRIARGASIPFGGSCLVVATPALPPA